MIVYLNQKLRDDCCSLLIRMFLSPVSLDVFLVLHFAIMFVPSREVKYCDEHYLSVCA